MQKHLLIQKEEWKEIVPCNPKLLIQHMFQLFPSECLLRSYFTLTCHGFQYFTYFYDLNSLWPAIVKNKIYDRILRDNRRSIR